MGVREQTMAALGHAYITDSPKPPSMAWLDKVVIVGELAYVSGHTAGSGKVPSVCSAASATKAAEDAAGSALWSLRHALGSLDRVQRIVRVTGYVNADVDFHQVSQVIHGASELLYKVFGDAGKHARTALGQAQLPANTAVEIELIAQVKPA